MIRRPTHRGISLVATSSLLALLLLVPAGVNAATPTVTLGGTLAPNPGTVSPGETVAFAVSFTNSDSSTISQLSLTTVDGTLTAAAATATGGSCARLAPLGCAYRNVKPLDTVTAFVVLNAKSANFGVQFRWDTTGQASDKGHNSHGVSFYWPMGSATTVAGTPIAVPVNGNINDYYSRYILTTNQTTVSDNQSVSSTNKQATKVIVPVTGIPVTLGDGGQAGTELSCGTCFGQTSLVQVNTGQLPAGGWFQVVLTLDSSEIPGPINQNNVKVFHQLDGGGTETISRRCTFSGGVPTTSAPCLVVRKLSGGDLEITVWTMNNGFMKPAG